MKNRKPVGKSNPKQDHKHVERVKVDCACDRDITIDELADAFPSQKKERLEKFLPHINSTFKKYNINQCMRKIHFLAQIGKESGSLTYTAEVLAKGKKESDVYDGYKGRGLIQITWKSNYTKYGQFIGVDLLDKNKIKLEEPDLATDSAGWYWQSGYLVNLNNLADINDLIAITVAINGGLNGFDARHALLKKAYESLNVVACKSLSVLKEAMPDVAGDALSVKEYKFSDSKIFKDTRASFAWGYWHDPKSKQKGVAKDLAKSKEGYARFLELSKTKPMKQKKAFNLTVPQMTEMARKALGLPKEEK
ncbi:glycoside hydrolase family 19 protein [Chromobacterium amazonense]|uniref:glycoside hydrolase family 19 protein n=1 Tax=Chromobacterium amazonense TaxID=1382803 RepID=UPI003F7A08B7